MHHNQCSQALLALKQETNCNVILLHHLSKEIKRKSDKSYKPDIVDIRGSQKVVDDVDAVFLTWRPDAYEDVISNDPSLEGTFVLVPAKYRDGSKDYDIMLKHDIKYSKFSNLD
jgi:replicative DNA helicase